MIQNFWQFCWIILLLFFCVSVTTENCFDSCHFFSNKEHRMIADNVFFDLIDSTKSNWVLKIASGSTRFIRCYWPRDSFDRVYCRWEFMLFSLRFNQVLQVVICLVPLSDKHYHFWHSLWEFYKSKHCNFDWNSKKKCEYSLLNERVIISAYFCFWKKWNDSFLSKCKSNVSDWMWFKRHSFELRTVFVVVLTEVHCLLNFVPKIHSIFSKSDEKWLQFHHITHR